MNPLGLCVLLLLPVVAWCHECAHDTLLRSPYRQRPATAPQRYKEGVKVRRYHPLATNRQPMRIKYFFDIHGDCGVSQETSGLPCGCSSVGQTVPTFGFGDRDATQTCGNTDVISNEHLAYIRGIIESAIDVLSKALAVDRVQGNLKLSSAAEMGYDGMSVDQHGNPVPKLDKTYCGSNLTNGVLIPQSHQTSGEGVPDADFVMYVSAVSNGPTSKTVAWALTCQEDTNSRPIAGHVNIDPNKVTISTGVKHRDNIATAIHEIMHALGFSSSSFEPDRAPKNWWPDGSPLKGDFTSGPDNTARLASPQILAAVRKHFGCNTLDGAMLENEGGSGTAYSHWEKRVFGNEIMTGVNTANTEQALSEVTLAFFADTGVYDANFSMAERYWWGKDRGCEFASHTASCSSQQSAAVTEFCWRTAGGSFFGSTSSDTLICGGGGQYPNCNPGSCDHTLRGQGYCSVKKYTSALPSGWQHFPSNSALGGPQGAMDFCPTVDIPDGQGDSQGSCLDETVDPSICTSVTDEATCDNVGGGTECTWAGGKCLHMLTDVLGYTYGPDSRCFETTYVISKVFLASQGDHARCFQVKCDASTKTYTAYANRGALRIDCPTNGGLATKSSEFEAAYNGDITCWTYADMCENRGAPFSTSSSTSPPTPNTPSPTTAPPPPTSTPTPIPTSPPSTPNPPGITRSPSTPATPAPTGAARTPTPTTRPTPNPLPPPTPQPTPSPNSPQRTPSPSTGSTCSAGFLLRQGTCMLYRDSTSCSGGSGCRWCSMMNQLTCTYVEEACTRFEVGATVFTYSGDSTCPTSTKSSASTVSFSVVCLLLLLSLHLLVLCA